MRKSRQVGNAYLATLGAEPSALTRSQNPCVSFDSDDPQFKFRTTLRTTIWLLRAGLWLWLGAPGRIRTCDTRFRKPMLYPLSYEG